MNFQEEMKLFMAKVLVVFVATGILLAVGVVSMAAVVASFSKTFDTKINAAIVEQRRWLETVPDRLAALPPEKSVEVHRKISSVVTEIQPYLLDLRPLFEAIYVGDSCKQKQ
jgi:hypothetical protein